MTLTPLGLVTSVAALLFLIISIRLIFTRRLLWKPFRLFGALVLFVGSIGLTSLSFDLSLYRFYERSEQLLELEVLASEEQSSTIQIKYSGADPESVNQYLVYGDSVQVDMRVILWNDWLIWMGVKPVYRLERVSGRYDVVASELNEPRSVYQFDYYSVPVSWWQILQSIGRHAGMRTLYGSANYVPLVAGAKYQVFLGDTGGMHTIPLNDQARAALTDWD